MYTALLFSLKQDFSLLCRWPDVTPMTFDLNPTSQHADDDGLGVLDQQLGLGDGGQTQVAGHVAAQLSIPLLQEAYGHRDGQRHHRSSVIVLYTTHTHTQSLTFRYLFCYLS